MKQKREGVVAKLKELQEECSPILKVIEDEALLKQLRNDKLLTLSHLEQAHQVDLFLLVHS